jgi:hypothetical protein
MPRAKQAETEEAAITPADVTLDTQVFTAFDRLTADVEEAEAKAVPTFGNYADMAINKKARSYLYGLRQVRAAIDRARKAQNDAAQSYIRKVNSSAKELGARMTALIDPHEKILKGIEEAEQERIAQHEANLDIIIQMGRCTILNSAQIQEYLDTLAEIDPTTFEEFTPKAAAEREIATTKLEKLLQAAIDHEAAEEERERQRVEAEEAERAKRDQDIADRAAARARAEAEAEAEEKIAAERARADAAERKAATPPPPAPAGSGGPLRLRKAPPPEPVPSPEAPTRAQRKVLGEILTNLYLDTECKDFVERLLADEVHPAITIDWSKVDA